MPLGRRLAVDAEAEGAVEFEGADGAAAAAASIFCMRGHMAKGICTSSSTTVALDCTYLKRIFEG